MATSVVSWQCAPYLPGPAVAIARAQRPSCPNPRVAVSQPFPVAQLGLLISARRSAVFLPATGGSSSSGSVAQEEVSTSSGSEGSAKEDDEEAEVSTSQSRSRSVSPTACQACGKEEKVGGCNGEGRILGGLSSVPGFGWFPIKAYRPCPAFVEAGGRYKRQGQSLEEVAFGRMGKQDNLDITERLQGGKKPK